MLWPRSRWVTLGFHLDVFVFVLVAWIVVLPAEIQGHVCEELLEGQLVPYLFCEETEADAAS